MQRLSGGNKGEPKQLPCQDKFLQTTDITPRDSQKKICWTSTLVPDLIESIDFEQIVHALFDFDATAAIRAAPLPEPSSDNIRVMLACGKISWRVSSI